MEKFYLVLVVIAVAAVMLFFAVLYLKYNINRDKEIERLKQNIKSLYEELIKQTHLMLEDGIIRY